ncbi:HIT family protein [Tenacibaculum sp. E3R01]|uniref:HIT family protein n=1 Tax=unclassified Tenacibaculum TaxID=2635139 RepID=UPI00089703AE|nr:MULTISPECIES: HIT family protein [unclassified Tenacibaculum]RBW62913.1 HIT family protein [Tenacibaculum sp. E3R01]SEE67394.1 Diadenosine tetraphosphate (Ap4A) hydrolase [Tenacibaculum sp. MAR_2010_89]
MSNCIFCDIVNGKAPAFKIWENEEHLAFLSIFPNTEGFTVVATKKHLSSYCFDLKDEELSKLIIAAKQVGKLLDEKLDDVGRTGLIMEGFGVDHTHVKLFPMHGTSDLKTWKPFLSKQVKYFEKYEGYISSHDCDRASDEKLTEVVNKIIN